MKSTTAICKHLLPTTRAARHLKSGRYAIQVADAATFDAVATPWMRAAGWNPGAHDVRAFAVADPAGLLLGLLDGVPIACLSAIRYSDTFGFMGCYLTVEEYRGHGYGLALHEAGRKHLHGCVQGGDGVLANVAAYERIGRRVAFRSARREGVSRGPLNTPRPLLPVVPADSVPEAWLHDLDRQCFPAPRTAFLHEWLRLPGAITFAVPQQNGEPDGVRAFGVARPVAVGWKVGPLFARDEDAACAVLTSLEASMPAGDMYTVDAPGCNSAAVAMADRRGLREVFATARMYTGTPPPTRLDWIYGITSFELG